MLADLSLQHGLPPGRGPILRIAWSHNTPQWPLTHDIYYKQAEAYEILAKVMQLILPPASVAWIYSSNAPGITLVDLGRRAVRDYMLSLNLHQLHPESCDPMLPGAEAAQHVAFIGWQRAILGALLHYCRMTGQPLTLVKEIPRNAHMPEHEWR